MEHHKHTSVSIAFADLHRAGTFVVPNPWDPGTARLLSASGFAALATTSGGLAFSLGRADGANMISREETLTNARTIADATPLPVTADLESGFGDGPEDVADTIRLVAAAGLAGGSVEDTTGDPDQPIRDLGDAVERVAAAAEAAHSQPYPFTLTARADNFLYGRPDLDDTISRLRAFAEAGADVLYAPGLRGLDDVKAVCSSVDKPVNVLVTGPLITSSVDELAGLGVRRISLGSALSRSALTSVLDAAREITRSGTFAFAAPAVGYADLNSSMGRS